MKKIILFRVDYGINIGGGHASRCLSLAKYLNKFKVVFVSSVFNKDFSNIIKKNGFQIFYLTNTKKYKKLSWRYDALKTIDIIEKNGLNPDLIIVDNYSLDYRWENVLRKHVSKIVVIDDLANRKHNCDILLDQNVLYSHKKYDKLLPKKCKTLLGPKYALLRTEFKSIHKKIKIRKKINRILISFGSSDPTNETLKAINGLKNFHNLKIDVVVGALNPKKNIIKKTCSKLNNFEYHFQSDKMALLMKNADLAIGGGGVTSWERCYLGLPSIISSLSIDQIQIAEDLSKKGAAINLGSSNQINSIDYEYAIKSLKNTQLKKMSEKSMRLVDGKSIIRIKKEIKILLEMYR